MSKSRICTLMYHDVYDISKQESGFNIDSNYQYKIPKEEFERQISAISLYIKDHNIDKNTILLSFDDGGVSCYTVIMPIIEKYGFKGYFYIPTKYIGQDGFLSEIMIQEMSTRGHHIGGHSHSHSQRMNSLSYETIKNDWSTCINIISKITGKKCIIASLPNGFNSPTIIKVLKELGIKYLYTSEPFELPKTDGVIEIRGRYGIKNKMSLTDVMDITFNRSRKRKIRIKKIILNVVKALMGSFYINVREFIFKHNIQGKKYS